MPCAPTITPLQQYPQYRLAAEDLVQQENDADDGGGVSATTPPPPPAGSSARGKKDNRATTGVTGKGKSFNPEDEYDCDDPFIDDTHVDDDYEIVYDEELQREVSSTKYTGFYVNAGGLERTSEYMRFTFPPPLSFIKQCVQISVQVGVHKC